MITPRDATADTMKQSLSYTIAALDAASELDIDLKDDDRAALAAERDTLVPLFDGPYGVKTRARILEDFLLGPKLRLQARVVLGDNVLDRGFEAGKARMKVELKQEDPDAADKVFGKRLTDTTRAPLAIEPGL